MALPASGPISMSMINTEANRAFNTVNTQLAGGSTPTVGSLVQIYSNSSVDQSAPHAISEFYGKSYVITVNIYAKIVGTDPGGIELYYGVNDVNTPFSAGSITTAPPTTPTQTLQVNYGDSVSVINLDGTLATRNQCSQLNSYCTVYECTAPSDTFTITANTDIYLAVDGNSPTC